VGDGGFDIFGEEKCGGELVKRSRVNFEELKVEK
jgi:hypothetical protein